MRILVTGGAGFIGSHIADLAVADGHEVYVIDDLSGGDMANLNKELAGFYHLDLRAAKPTLELIQLMQPDIVFHLAANAAENKAQFSPIDVTSRNWNTFINTLVPAINGGVKRFVVTSSIAVYGDLKPPFKETDRPEPEDLYGISKYAMEEALAVMAKVHDFEYVITRPHNVYGPRQNMKDPYRNVVTIFMNALLKGEPYYIYGDGEQRRCFSYIDPVAKAIYDSAFIEDANGKAFNIGADTDYSVNELSGTIQDVSDIAIDPIYIEDRPQEVKVATADHTLAKELLGYKDDMPLQEGLRRTWEYCLSMGPQEAQHGGIEIDSDKLPENWK